MSKWINRFAMLRNLMLYLRQSWPQAILVLPEDSRFCSKAFMDWAQGEKYSEFITGLIGNMALNHGAKTTIESAQREYTALMENQ